MPPRSATRKKSTPASARARKSKLKSEQLDVESSLVDQNKSVSELENKGQELAAVEDAGVQQEGVPATVKEEEGEPAAQLVTMSFGEAIKQEVGALDPNSTEVEGLPSGGEGKVGVSTAVEVKIKEEVVEEGSNFEGVMGDHMNVYTESLIQGGGVAEEDRERMEGLQSEAGLERNDNAHMADVTEKCDNAAEENGVEGEQNESRHIVNGGTELGIVPVAEQNSCEEGTAAAQMDADALGDNVLALNEGIDGEGGDEGGGKDEEDIGDSEEDKEVDNEDEEHSSLFITNHITGRKKEKDLEIFIGRLDKGAVEDDLIKIFGEFGEIRAARVVRNRTTNKSRGYAFIQYATVEHAKNALSALKGGIEVRGKPAKISASQDNDALYMGNICKLWTKERVLGALKSYGIENIEEIYLPDDPRKEGKIKGFALLEFSTHSDAMAAFQRLRKPDAVFGSDRSAKVAFAQTPMHPNQEVLSQVKTIYVEGLTDSWNEDKIKEICEQYGEIVEVKSSRSLGTKRKDFGFITFTSRESALACVEGINNAHIGGGEVKVKASIAKPHFKGRLQKQGTRGGFKVETKRGVTSTKEENERQNKAVSSKTKGHAKSKRAKKKGKMVAEEKGTALSEAGIGEGGKPNKPQIVTEGQSIRASSKSERTNRKRENLRLKTEGRGKIEAEHGHNAKPSKKPQGNMQGRHSNNSRKRKRDAHNKEGSNYGGDFIRFRNPYAPGYAASPLSYQSHAYNNISGSKRPYADMEPHAGYLEPVAQNQGRSYSGYLEPPVGMQYQLHAGYLKSAVRTQTQPHTGYHEPAVGKHGKSHAGYLQPALGTHGQPHAGYLEPSVGRQGRSHAGYFESAAGKYSHDPHDLVLRRAGGQDLLGSGHSAYGPGSSLPTSYVPNYTGYAGYEDGSSVGGHYQNSGAHVPPRRAYY